MLGGDGDGQQGGVVVVVLSAGGAFPWRSRPAYGDWLAQTYHYVFHTPG